MKRKKLVVAIAVVGLVGVATLLIVTLDRGSEANQFPEPEWVTAIRDRIDLDSCSADNCGACNAERCSEFAAACAVEQTRYACGPACDALISYCVDVGPSETGGAPCESDSDCWCRSFTGAQFIPGERVPNRCSVETNRCDACFYE